MKELSIEEKVYGGNYKAYIELINRLEDVKEAIKKQNYGIAMNVLCKPYPEFQVTKHSELKESEDERIRKLLIEAVIQVLQDQYCSNRGVSKEKVVAWLEKQGNLMKALQISNEKIGELIEKNYYLKEQLEKQGEQKPTKEHNACEFCEDRYGCVSPCSMKLIEKKKPAWSENDNTAVAVLRNIIKESDIINSIIYTNPLKEKLYDWLKSLKERYTCKLSDE